jgi:hypothetical protein
MTPTTRSASTRDLTAWESKMLGLAQKMIRRERLPTTSRQLAKNYLAKLPIQRDVALGDLADLTQLTPRGCRTPSCLTTSSICWP